MHKNFHLVVLAVFLAALLFWAFLNAFKTSKATVTILVIPQSQQAAFAEKNIVKNISELPTTLAFYDRLLQTNPDLRDVAAGKSPNERKFAWNKMLLVEKMQRNSSFIKISALAANPQDAKLLANKAVRNLFDQTNFYYNIKTDIDLRIADGPIAEEVYPNRFLIFFMSTVFGGLLAFAAGVLAGRIENLIVASREKKAEPESGLQMFETEEKVDEALEEKLKESSEEISDAATAFGPADAQEQPHIPENIPEDRSQYDKEIETLNKIIQQDVYPNFPEVPTHGKAKAQAPDNLPIGDTTYTFEYKEEPKEESKTEDIQPAADSKREPTPEELKKRLNQLLKGEL